jgi:hypothetical protein
MGVQGVLNSCHEVGLWICQSGGAPSAGQVKRSVSKADLDTSAGRRLIMVPSVTPLFRINVLCLLSLSIVLFLSFVLSSAVLFS